jgi:hypothetical protein
MGPKGWLTSSVVPFTGSYPKSEEHSPYTLSCLSLVLILSTPVWPSLKWSLPFNISCYNSIFISKLACVFDMPNLSHSPSFNLHTKQHLNLHILVWNYVHLLSWYAVCIPILQCPRYHITGLENHYIISQLNVSFHMPLSSWHGMSSICRGRRRPPDMNGTSQYIE